MTPLHRHTPHPWRPALPEGRWRTIRRLLLIPLVAIALTLASCSGGGLPFDQSGVAFTDTQPVGDGLKVIGYAMLGAAVVFVLGRAIR